MAIPLLGSVQYVLIRISRDLFPYLAHLLFLASFVPQQESPSHSRIESSVIIHVFVIAPQKLDTLIIR